jgi:hypothetical protein
MNKDVTICFRTTDKLRKGIEVLSAQEKRSLSSTIEMMLNTYLLKNSIVTAQDEKRRFSRKEVAIPALIKSNSHSAGRLEGGVVRDLSLGGLRITVPKDASETVAEDSIGTSFETAFVLPEVSKPVRLQCKSERVESINGDIHVGATIIDADFTHYQYLHKYLVQ